MSNIHYTTLAAARLANPQKFDQALTKVITLAVRDVGDETFVRAMRDKGHVSLRTKSETKAA